MNSASELLLEAIMAHPKAVNTSAELEALTLVASGALLSVPGKRWHFKASPSTLESVRNAVANELNDIVEESRK